jgi:hypothetical protein
MRADDVPMMLTTRPKEGHLMRRIGGALALLLGVSLLCPDGQARADQIVCRSTASTVQGVTRADTHAISTKYQVDNPNLEPLLTTTVTVTGTGLSCIVAHLSALVRITDNYVVFQVRVDGVPMEGHLPGLGPVATPVVYTAIDTWINDPASEQLSDPTKMVAFNFFKTVKPGVHTVEVLVAAGSNIWCPSPSDCNKPTVTVPVLTLEYR